ncbi:MAG: hypothetical protein PUC05_04715 [Firmicutes bacterium]|nr:hypothetical protein [Bacillota bacterium]
MNKNDIFLNKIIEIKKALSAELYNCALALSLTLPDVCGKIEFPNEALPGNRYKKWFSSYATTYFTTKATSLPSEEIVEYAWLSAEECWALRCAFLHAGNFDVDHVSLANIRIHAHKRDGENYSHMVRDSKYVDWDVIKLCKNLCSAAEQYYHSVEDKTPFILDEVGIETW